MCSGSAICHGGSSGWKGLRPAFYLKLDTPIEIGKCLEAYRRTCLSAAVAAPFVGMLEAEIGKTRCGVYCDATLFSNSHCYSWRSESGISAMNVICRDGVVTEVNKLSYETCWDADEAPRFAGVSHKLLEDL